jgi:hypothetical protein
MVREVQDADLKMGFMMRGYIMYRESREPRGLEELATKSKDWMYDIQVV